jgi:hypothetical protein
MPWFTLTDNFDADFGVDEWHGTNVFYRDGDRVFRTYFIQTPTYKWWNWHDSYVADAASDKKWVEVSDAGEAAFRNQHASTKL